MAIKLSTGLKNYMLATGSFRAALESANAAPAGLYVYYFNGPVPENADDALDMLVDHTQLVKLGADATAIANPIVPLEFDTTATGGYIGKDPTQTWHGVADFDGVNDASGTLTATFFRICAGGDNGRGAGTGTSYRVQGTIGALGADLLMPNPTITNGGTETRGLSLVQFNIFG